MVFGAWCMIEITENHQNKITKIKQDMHAYSISDLERKQTKNIRRPDDE